MSARLALAGEVHRTRASLIDLVASCVTLYSVAITLPLLDLLGRNPEFFVAHRLGGADVVVTAVVIAVVIPVLLGGLVAVVDRIDDRAGRALHGAVVVVLGATVAVVLLKASRLDGMPWPVHAVIAAAAGSALLLAYHRFANVRWVLRVGVLVPLVLVGLFLLGSRTAALVLPSDVPVAAPVVFPDDAPPIVMLVFDELPLASLIDGDGHIQAGPYPNLARLSADGTWYRNTTTVASHTTWAVPGILTGRTAPADSVPTAGDHPNNLFTWAGSHYDLRVFESVTQLCPESMCGDSVRDQLPPTARWRSLWSDLRVVAGHVFLPDGVAARLLPAIDQNWAGFTAENVTALADGTVPPPSSAASDGFVMKERFTSALEADRRNQVSAFLDLIRPSGTRPPLYFAHFLLPHAPWEYLPDGRRYNPIGVDNTGAHPSWSDDEWAVTQAQQRHLAQAEYVDHIVGQVVDRLLDVGVYDSAVVVVAADHGIAIRPGVKVRRRLDAGSIADVAAVPLIIKAPGQSAAVVDDYPASLVDVVPTIAAMVGAELPWAVEGISLVDADRPVRPTRSYIPVTGHEPVVYTSPLADVITLGASRVDRFGDIGVFGLAPPGQATLLGAPVASLDAAVAAERRAAFVLNAADYEDVAAAADGLPTVIKVRLSGPDAEPGEVVAVALNGTVTAVAMTYAVEGEEALFMTAMMNPLHFVDGTNRIELFHVTGTGAERTLQEIAID